MMKAVEQVNKAQKEVQQAQLDEEKKVIRLLEVVYERAKKDCEQKIREGQGRNIEKQTDRSGNLMNLLTLAVRKCKHRVLVVLQGMCVTVDVVYCNVQNGL